MTQLASVSSDNAVTVEPALLDGKFRAPAAGPDVVHRERLTALIEEATERPVTVITAPPGAGQDRRVRRVGGRARQVQADRLARAWTRGTGTRRASGRA